MSLHLASAVHSFFDRRWEALARYFLYYPWVAGIKGRDLIEEAQDRSTPPIGKVRLWDGEVKARTPLTMKGAPFFLGDRLRWGQPKGIKAERPPRQSDGAVSYSLDVPRKRREVGSGCVLRFIVVCLFA